MAKTLSHYVEIWQRTPPMQRVLLAVILVGCLGAGALLVNWARQPKMAMLYTGLEREEASRIVDQIRDSGLAYKLTDGGTTVMVPEEKVYSLRLSMASQGLPTGGQAGYRILDGEGIGTSPFTQRVNYRRALEGELAKTIQMLEGVTGVRVHIARPEPTLFGTGKTAPSATVALKLRAGHRLSSANIAGIVHLVAGSVEGLAAERVVIVDGQGSLLSGQEDSELAGGSSSFLDYKTRVESYFADKAEAMLEAVLGPNRASVRVGATIETSSVDQTRETYDPEARAVLKEEIKIKSSTPPAGSEPAAGAATKEENTLSEYAVGKTVERRQDLPGKVAGLSVAALVDITTPIAGADGSSAPPNMTLADAEAIIRSALGLTEKDSVKVVGATFHQPVEVEEGASAGGLGSKEFYLEIAKRGSLAVLVIGALLAMKLLGGRKKEATTELALPGGQVAAGELVDFGQAGAEPEQLRARITHALQENPDQVRRLFLTWAQSEEGGQ